MTSCIHGLLDGTCAPCQARKFQNTPRLDQLRPHEPVRIRHTRPARTWVDPRSLAGRQAAEAARDRIERKFEAEVAEAMEAVETGVQDCKNDGLAPDASDSDLYHEIVGSIAAMCRPEVANEVRRRFGFDPINDF